MAQLNCIVVTPERTALEEKADFITLTLYDGEIGIAPLHSPLIGRLGFGELRLRVGEKTTRYYVDGGFVQVADDVVSVLTNRVVPVRELNARQSEEQLASAQKRPATSPELLEIRDRAVAQARAQLRMAKRS